jgi:hypothetical protein
VCPATATVGPFFPAKPASGTCDRFDRCTLATAAKKNRKPRLTRADEDAESPKMNPTQKQFSLNRAASKSKFLSVFMKTETIRMTVMIAISAALAFQPACKPKPSKSEPAPSETESKNESGIKPRSETVAERNQIRRNWALKALQSGYQASGHANARWDQQVLATFEAMVDAEYSRISTTPWRTLDDAISQLAETGCDDPMIEYLRLSRGPGEQKVAETAADFVRVHDRMLQTQYHPAFKFLAGLEAVNHLRSADANSSRSERITLTTISLVEAVRDTNAPGEDIAEAVTLWLKHSSTPQWITYVMDRVGPPLEAGWSHTDILPLIKGRGAIRAAWADRGNDYADKVTAQGWQGFETNLAQAEKHLTQAWSRNPNNPETAYLMMMVELGQGRGQVRMQKWFDHAMQLDPNYYDAAKQMSYYLQPRWYGSDAAALSFARSCVTSTNWGGKVPLVLADLHRSLARYNYGTNQQPYWQQPAVWPDMKSSWEKFFAINPDSVGWRHDYARDAYRCGQYAVFLEQVAQFANRTNHAFFGGEKAFRDMLETATAATNATKHAN